VTVLVLLPGMDGSGTLFDDFISVLDAKTVVVSYPRDRELDYEQLVPIVEAALPVDEPFILLGESFSGPIAISLAAKNLPGCRALVLVCTFAKLHPDGASRRLRGLVPLFPFWRLPVRMGAAALLGRLNSPALRTKLSAAIKGVMPAVWRARMRAILGVDVTASLAQITVPVLYLRASDDRVIPAAASEIIMRARPTTSFVTIDGPHALLQCKPNECASAIKAFASAASIHI
jgi:pimeloyl-[acyl-carrier protein] methyl ester esterase